MINDTACKDCPFKKMGFDECPNYIETLWHEQGNPQPRIVKDCSPKRNLLMLQELYNRTFSLHQQITQQEKEIGETKAAVNKLIEFISYLEEQREAEKSNKQKLVRHMQSMKYFEPKEYEKIE